MSGDGQEETVFSAMTGMRTLDLSASSEAPTAAPAAAAVTRSISSSGKPLPGASFRFVEGVSPDVPINTWSKCDHRKFNVRSGPNYEKNKKKEPSASPLYDVFAVGESNTSFDLKFDFLSYPVIPNHK